MAITSTSHHRKRVRCVHRKELTRLRVWHAVAANAFQPAAAATLAAWTIRRALHQLGDDRRSDRGAGGQQSQRNHIGRATPHATAKQNAKRTTGGSGGNERGIGFVVRGRRVFLHAFIITEHVRIAKEEFARVVLSG